MKRFWMLGCCLLLAIGLRAQEVYNSSGRRTPAGKPQAHKGFDPDRLIIGGGLGLSLGTVTNIAIAPKVGYRFSDQFAAGIGLGYQYYKFKDYFQFRDQFNNLNYLDYKTSIFSAGVWARYVVWQNIFVHAEYEHNFMRITDYFGYDPNGSGNIITRQGSYNAPSLLLGVGFRQPVSDHVSLNATLLYDVIQNEYSPYYGRIFPTIGFLVGF